MKKIYILMEDRWHKREVIVPGMEAALGKDGFVATDDPEQIPWDTLEQDAVLLVSQKGENEELPDGTKFHWITDERVRKLWNFVNAGGAALFIHCGTVLDNAGGNYLKLAGGTFRYHPQQCPVTYVPIPKAHPIVEDVEPFTVIDEHYYCQIAVQAVTPFLIGGSENSTTLTGWCQEIGKGRTAALTPGHTIEAATNPNMTRLIRNAVQWVTRNK
jgi:type 1 glutamine amidotransferase